MWQVGQEKDVWCVCVAGEGHAVCVAGGAGRVCVCGRRRTCRCVYVTVGAGEGRLGVCGRWSRRRMCGVCVWQ